MIDNGEVFKADLTALDRLIKFEFWAANPVRTLYSNKPEWTTKNTASLELVPAGRLRHRVKDEIGLISLMGFSDGLCMFQREGRIRGEVLSDTFIDNIARGLRHHKITDPADLA
jgi:hypothetical protein